MKTNTLKMIDVLDWDDLVVETYGRPYNYQQQEGCQSRGIFKFSVPLGEVDDEEMPDSVPDVINGEEMGVKFSSWLKRDPKEWNGIKGDEKWLDLFWDRNFYPSIYMVIDDLYKKGLIEKGDYVINIDW